MILKSLWKSLYSSNTLPNLIIFAHHLFLDQIFLPNLYPSPSCCCCQVAALPPFPLILVLPWEFGVFERSHLYLLGLTAPHSSSQGFCSPSVLTPLYSGRKSPTPQGSVARWAPDTPGCAAEACIFPISHLSAHITHTCGHHCLKNIPAPEPSLNRSSVKHG